MPRERGNGIFSLDTMSEVRGMGGGEEKGTVYLWFAYGPC